LVAIVLGVTDAGSGAYDLDIPRYGTPLIADAVFMSDGALADVGDDFHVRMGMKAEARPRSDLVIVPDHESAEWAVRPITVGRNDEVVTRLQPAVIALIERFLGSKLQHDRSSSAVSFRGRLWRLSDRPISQQIMNGSFYLVNGRPRGL